MCYSLLPYSPVSLLKNYIIPDLKQETGKIYQLIRDQMLIKLIYRSFIHGCC